MRHAIEGTCPGVKFLPFTKIANVMFIIVADSSTLLFIANIVKSGACGTALTLRVENAGSASFPEAWPGYRVGSSGATSGRCCKLCSALVPEEQS